MEIVKGFIVGFVLVSAILLLTGCTTMDIVRSAQLECITGERVTSVNPEVIKKKDSELQAHLAQMGLEEKLALNTCATQAQALRLQQQHQLQNGLQNSANFFQRQQLINGIFGY